LVCTQISLAPRIRNLAQWVFSATITADKQTKLTIKRKLLALLKEAGQSVEKAPSEEVFQLNLDLFSL